MKKYCLALLILSSLGTVPVWAQSDTVNAVQATPAPPVPEKATTIGDFYSKRVTLSLNNVPAEQALTQLLDASGCSYEFDHAFYSDLLTVPFGTVQGQPSVTLDLPPRLVTMKLVNATLPNALTSVCRAIGVSWQQSSGSEPKDVPVIRIVRTPETVTRADLLRKQTALSGGLGGGGFGGGGFGGAGGGSDERIRLLGNAFKPVSVDVKDKPVRGALVDVFKAAQIDYVFDEDVATAKNVTIVLNNVSARTALDALCESAGVGWTVENPRDQRSSGTIRVRVGKGYAPAAPR